MKWLGEFAFRMCVGLILLLGVSGEDTPLQDSSPVLRARIRNLAAAAPERRADPIQLQGLTSTGPERRPDVSRLEVVASIAPEKRAEPARLEVLATPAPEKRAEPARPEVLATPAPEKRAEPARLEVVASIAPEKRAEPARPEVVASIAPEKRAEHARLEVVASTAAERHPDPEGGETPSATPHPQARARTSVMPVPPAASAAADRTPVPRPPKPVRRSPLALVPDGELVVANGTFSGIAYDGQVLWVTWGNGADVFLQGFNEYLAPMTDQRLLIDHRQTPTGQPIADHAYLYLDNHHYLAISDAGDRNLSLVRFDASFTQDLPFTPVTGEWGTNDPLLATNGRRIFAGCMCNPDRRGLAFFEYGQMLGFKRRYTVQGAANPAGFTFADNQFFLAYNEHFAEGDVFIRPLTRDFEPAMPPQSVVSGSTELEFMPTGLLREPGTGAFILANTEGTPDEPDEYGPLVVRVLDRDLQETDEAWYSYYPRGARAHMTVAGEALFVTYDTPGSFQIRLQKFRLVPRD